MQVRPEGNREIFALVPKLPLGTTMDAKLSLALNNIPKQSLGMRGIIPFSL